MYNIGIPNELCLPGARWTGDLSQGRKKAGLNWICASQWLKCQPVVLTGLNRFKPGKIEFMPANGIKLSNFSRFKPGGINHLPTLICPMTRP